MKDRAPQAQPLPRLPERSRRNRQPPVSASRTPTANAVASARVSRRESLAERGAELPEERSDYWRRRHSGRRPRFGGDGGQSAALAVGVRPQRGDTDTLTRRVGVWPNSLFSGGTACVVPEENLSVGHDLHEEGQISWLSPRARCPKD